MLKKTVTVINRAGVHARPAAMLVHAVKDFECEIYCEKDNDRINGKSIMGIITLGAAYGSEITIITEGRDEQQALDALVRLFETKFEEE
ncbi:MAG: HPr family phosphocarrier protein [Treponema sp.]|jgi:phosphocarrier protein|nr:HPr family phosphocarrier protein [Treponema sp.]